MKWVLISTLNRILIGISLKVIACITDSRGQQVSTSNCSTNITVIQALQPTHYISLSMGFVPTQLSDYFQKYIVDISEQLFTKIAYPPAPWIYVKTTYDRVKNAFNLWFYLPSTMSPDFLSDLWQWAIGWGALIVGAILAIIGGAIIFTGGAPALVAIFGTGGVYYLASGAALIAIGFYTTLNNQEILKNTITNQGQQLSQINKENQGKNTLNQAWGASSQAQTDCLNRLKAYRGSTNVAVIEGHQ